MQDYIRYDPNTGNVMLWCKDQWYWYCDRQQPLGKGGMGSVYIGRNYHNTVKVAIKRVHDRFADIPEIRERARSEAALTFHHPNLVEMIGYCESATGRGPVFIISKYVGGQTIDTFIKDSLAGLDSRTVEKRIIEMMMPVLDALELIHGKNIVHMDIKPSNIMVEQGRNVRLMDLGIAYTPRKGGASDMSGSSSSSSLMGTPQYAAPEQFSSTGGTVDCRADIYQVGVTLYELITGENPFKANTLKESIEKHQKVLLPKRREISEEVLDVVRKATNPKAEHRYASIGELRVALNQSIAVQVPKHGFLKKILDKIS